MIVEEKNEILKTYCREGIDQLQSRGLHRSLQEIEGPQQARVKIGDKEYLNFCSNNYLGLANDQRLVASAVQSLQKEGFGSGASRLVCGSMSMHHRLEESIARFKGTEKCLLFSSGYMANVGIISSLFNRGDCIFWDRLNHASLIDGIFLSGAQHRRYPHNDMSALEEMLKNSNGYKKRAVITDSVFSMDGDIAPLDKIVNLAQKYNCIVMIDEAHSFGVMGESGKGLAEHFGVEREVDIQMGTLSKAAGSFGAYVCGSNELIDYLINKARSFIYTTAMPPSIAAASLKAVELIQNDIHLRKKLWENTQYLITGINHLGFNTLHSVTPIIPILLKDSQLAVEFSNQLFKYGILASAIRPPTVAPHSARLRFTTMATHTRSDLDYALEKIRLIGRDLEII